jgi:hypothetical protein
MSSQEQWFVQRGWPTNLRSQCRRGENLRLVQKQESREPTGLSGRAAAETKPRDLSQRWGTPWFVHGSDGRILAGLSASPRSEGQPEEAAVPQASKEPDERQRWEDYLGRLDNKVASGKITEAQCRRARQVWSRAVEQTPRLRAPTAGVNEDGEYYFDWNYGDLPGLTLSLTFTKEGLVDWFFRDKENKVAKGTDEPTNEVPGEVYTYLRLFQR